MLFKNSGKEDRVYGLFLSTRYHKIGAKYTIQTHSAVLCQPSEQHHPRPSQPVPRGFLIILNDGAR